MTGGRYGWVLKRTIVGLFGSKCLCVCLLQNLHKQLEEAIQDGEIWVMQLKDTEYELDGSRERVQQQATEILHKASEFTDDLQYTSYICKPGACSLLFFLE